MTSWDMSSTLCLYFYHDQSKVFGLLNLVYMRNKTDFHCCLLGNLPPRICLSSFWFCILDPHRHNRNLVHWWQEALECIHSTRTRCSSCHQMLKCKVSNILKKVFLKSNLLLPSGDLGIGLVWDNLSPPHPGPQFFGPTVEILFKLN